MKNILLILFSATVLFASSCYKDKGNYDYNVPEEPIITNVDTVYSVFIGDTLNVTPVIKFSRKQNLSYEWKIGIPEELRAAVYTGPQLKIAFGLGASRYMVRLAVLDSLTGIKYFRDFIIAGKTIFSKGSTVLSLDGTTSKLSFIKPDGSVVPNVYETVNGKQLLGSPVQLVPVFHQYISNGLYLGYWITNTQADEGGIMIDPNTFKIVRTLRNNFFNAPATAKPGYLSSNANGALEGIVNGKLNVGTSQTYYLSPIYGFFGVGAEGDYEAYRKCLANPAFPFYFGYDVNRKQFIGFTNFGSAAYIGTGYQVVNTVAFDPKNVGLDLIDLEQINPTDGYAFGKSADGTIYELKYSMGFPGIIQITPNYKRPFIQQSLIKPTTLWQATSAQIFYFTSNDKIYRYNPLTEDVKVLTTDFKGKNVTMIKIADGGSTLIAGVDGSIYYLDVSVGKFGDVVKKIDGIPGAPVDITTR